MGRFWISGVQKDYFGAWDQDCFYGSTPGVDFLAFPPINIGERYKKIFDLRKVISQSEIPFDLKQLHQLSVSL